MKILCFGDSNTYGYIPGGRGRFDALVRYPKVMEKILGKDYSVYEDGLCGRTTIFDRDDVPGRKGIDFVRAAVATYQPDLLIVMLGTNDCKTQFETDEAKIAQGLADVVSEALQERAMQVILVSPIAIDPIALQLANYYTAFSIEVSEKLGVAVRKIAEINDYGFVDAAHIAKAHLDDGEHLDHEGHSKLAEVLAKKIREFVFV
ncbi:MAG: GDSL-type esterase/lipase family protein [Bacilli bacterium]